MCHPSHRSRRWHRFFRLWSLLQNRHGFSAREILASGHYIFKVKIAYNYDEQWYSTGQGRKGSYVGLHE